MGDWRNWTVGTELVHVGLDGEVAPPLEIGRIYIIDFLDMKKKGDLIPCWPGGVASLPGDMLYVGLKGFGTLSFLALMFRPVERRETNISIFTAMLTPAARPKVDA